MQYHAILRDYLLEYALPAMLREGWWFKAAKSYGWQKAARGADFHVDQPLRTHILNGLYALTRSLEYLEKHGYYSLGENDFKRTLVLYSMHDAYKDSDLARWRVGTSDFDIPLIALNDLLARMKLREFVSVKAEDLRAASVALLSPKVADISACTPGITRLLTLVHLADSFASQQSARDYVSAENRLRELSRDEATRSRNYSRISQRLGESPPDVDSHTELAIYYHELDDYRGISTLLIHQATEEELAPFGLNPILYFANGILYIGPAKVKIDVEEVRTKVAARLFSKIRQEAGDEKLTIAKQACDPRKGMKIEKYAYLFCTLEHLLDAVIEKTALGKAKGAVNNTLADYATYNITLRLDENLHQAQHWIAATKLVMIAENIAQVLVPGDILEWLFATFQTPIPIAAVIRKNLSQLFKGGVPKYCYIIAYYWLTQTHFPPDNRSWLEVDTASVQQEIKRHVLRALKVYDTEEKILAYVEKELGIQGDVRNYLQSTLLFSFDLSRAQIDDPLQEYEKERRKTHKRLCTICNRLITSQVSKKSTEIKTAIAEQPAQIFSNRRVPTLENSNDMMVWCPMCYLEFMLRKLNGHGYPEGGDYNGSYRLYLYVLPDYSFTPELWTTTGEQLLQDFHPRATTVTRLALRGSKDDPSIPRRWLEYGTVDETWLEQVQEVFAEQAERMKTRGKRGDRLTFSFTHPNYMLFSYDNVVSERDKSGLKPTRTEVWAKSLYAAILLHLLTGVRIYITDRPYLTFTRPEEMKTIIEMEGLHPLLCSLLPVKDNNGDAVDSFSRASEASARLSLAAVPALLDLLAAIWEINAALYPTKPNELRNLDKQIASILEEIKTNYLAGATLFKTRERHKSESYPMFTRACQILLPQGVEVADGARHILHESRYMLMLDKEGGALMNLAQEITDRSLQIYDPTSQPKKGRVHRFETLFRTGVEAIKCSTNRNLSEEELTARVAGTILKRLERLLEDRKKGYGPLYGVEQVKGVQKLAELLVHELFGNRCGCSISTLTHEENHLADAIYFLTLQKKYQYWEDKRKAEQVSNGLEPID